MVVDASSATQADSGRFSERFFAAESSLGCLRMDSEKDCLSQIWRFVCLSSSGGEPPMSGFAACFMDVGSGKNPDG